MGSKDVEEKAMLPWLPPGKTTDRMPTETTADIDQWEKIEKRKRTKLVECRMNKQPPPMALAGCLNVRLRFVYHLCSHLSLEYE